MPKLPHLFAPLCLLPALATLHAQVPHLINYQGRMVVDGVNFEGQGKFKFALMNGTGPGQLWTSSPDVSPADGVPDQEVTLPVAKGLYSVALGDTALAGMAAIPATVFTNPDVRLRVWFNDGTGSWEQLSPDQRIAAVGYAIIAGTVPDGAITAEKIATGAVGSTHLAPGAVSGNAIAPGTITPAHLSPGFTLESLGAETPAGAQAKIDAALSASLGSAGGMAALKATLGTGHLSAGIHIIGDSTNTDSTWSLPLAQSIGQLYPAYTVKRTEWTPNSATWAAPVTIRQGTGNGGGERRWEIPGPGTYSPLGHGIDFPMPPAGDLDLRAKVRIDDPAITNILFAKMDSGAGNSSFRIQQDTAASGGRLRIDYSTTGANYATAASTVAPSANGITTGQIFWARVTVQLNAEAASKTFTFYTSTNGTTWQPLGTPVTTTDTAAAAIASTGANCYLGGWGGLTQFRGAIYSIEMRGGINGPTSHPLNIDAWTFNEGIARLEGAPELWFANASWAGAKVDNFITLNSAFYCRNYSPQVIFISLSHNSPRETGTPFLNMIKTLVANTRSQFGEIPKIIFLTQNPQVAVPSATIDPQSLHLQTLAQHRVQFMTWANNAGHGVIDTWAAFEKDPRPLSELVGTVVWGFKPVTSLASSAPGVVTLQVSDVSLIAALSSRGITLRGIKRPDGSNSPYNAVWPLLSKGSSTSGPGTITIACPLDEAVDLTTAEATPCDAIHPTHEGYKLWANTILTAFRRGTP